MPDLAANQAIPTGGFEIKGKMMRYNVFAPRLYNFCKSLGFVPGEILPSRAFCSDESQGYPVIMLAKHFGAFPFNHGQVGGIVATDRHGPHAEHGNDLLLIQASHVGYDPETRTFGTYRRIQTHDHGSSPTCGKLHGILEWYQAEYEFAGKNIQLSRDNNGHYITIDNHLLRDDLSDGLILRLDRLLASDEVNGDYVPMSIRSTSKTYRLCHTAQKQLKDFDWTELRKPIGKHLIADLFYFRHDIEVTEEGRHYLEANLLRYMPGIVTSDTPMLLAAQINTQIEFDRTFRTIVKHHSYRGKKVLFIAGLHIDISPRANQIFPLTKFVPWAAYVQREDETFSILEQDELLAALTSQSTENPDQINLEEAIQVMAETEEVKVFV